MIKVKNTTLSYFFTCCFFFFTTCGYAQVNDFGAWTAVSLDKKLSNKFTLVIAEEIRFFQNLQRLNLTYTNLGLSYKLNKSIKLTAVYRFIQKYRDENDFSWRHRIYLDAQFKEKYYPFTFVYRARLQTQVRDYYSSDDGKFLESYWRNKFDVRREFGKGFSPYLAAEFRYQFYNDRNKEANNKFNRGRYFLGCQYQYTESKTFDVFFMHQREINVNNRERNYIIGFEYSYSF
jgi:hypothetical protein